MRADTVVVSVMHANNEVGTIQPVEEIGGIVRERRQAGQNVFLHSDGVQAFGKVEVNVERLGVDLYSISGHKIFAPKGIGGLYVRSGTRLRGIQFGGRHERERRAGTENVPGAMALARAVELCAADKDGEVAILRDHFEREVLSRVPDVDINGAKERRLPNTSNLLFHGVSGEGMLIALDMRGMAVSTGAACSSGATEPSHVLLAMGRSGEEARSSIRFSFGRYNTAEEVNALVEAVVVSAGKLRSAARREKYVAV
jgi:cysteine desulfurase